jgi:hypothetical protein
MEEEETNVVEKPRPWGFIAGWDKSYEMIDKTSWEVKRARETFRLKATKAKIFIEKGGGKEEGRDEVLPSPWAAETKTRKYVWRENRG